MVSIGPWLRLAAALAAAIGCLAVIVASSVPNLIFLDQPLLDLLMRKAGHVFVFFGIVLAGGVALDGLLSPRVTATILVMASMVIALLDEFNQRQIAGRLASPVDVALDLVGALSGAAAYIRLAKRDARS
jgi:VanZ family protein